MKLKELLDNFARSQYDIYKSKYNKINDNMDNGLVNEMFSEIKGGGVLNVDTRALYDDFYDGSNVDTRRLLYDTNDNTSLTYDQKLDDVNYNMREIEGLFNALSLTINDPTERQSFDTIFNNWKNDKFSNKYKA